VTGSYFAGVARRAARGRTALLPPVTPWGTEARQVMDQPEASKSPAPAPASEEVPRAAARARRPAPVTSKSTVAEPASNELNAVPEPSPLSPTPALAPASLPESKPTKATPSTPLERARVKAANWAEVVSEAAAPAEAVPNRSRTREGNVEARSPEPLVPRESAERRAGPRSAVPPVRIESIEVVVERPQAPVPFARQVERTRARIPGSEPTATLARGFSSFIGTRQG
jgi:hypothetical protein